MPLLPTDKIRIYLRSERRDQKGKLTERANWVIRDGKKYVPTGCAAEEVGEAERALNQYLVEKYLPKRKEQDIEAIAVADVLSIFVDDRREHQRNKRSFDERIARLNDWWGEKALSEINGETCRAYQRHRGNRGGARRDLEDLRASINHHAKEGLHRGIVRVALPPQGQPRDRWLTRSEAAAILWKCWRAREVQTVHRGKLKGQKIETEKRPLRHIARFILVGLYTGTRAGAIASASPIQAMGNSYVDLQRGIFYRLAEGQVRSKKRQTPVPLPPRLLAHMRRWWDRKLIQCHFVEFNGEAVGSVKTGFRRAASLAGLSGKVELRKIGSELNEREARLLEAEATQEESAEDPLTDTRWSEQDRAVQTFLYHACHSALDIQPVFLADIQDKLEKLGKASAIGCHVDKAAQDVSVFMSSRRLSQNDHTIVMTQMGNQG